MKKRKIALFGIVALAGLSLASCKNDKEKDPKPTPTPTPAPGVDSGFVSNLDKEVPANRAWTTSNALDIHLNYNGNAGITYASESSYLNPIDNTTYTKGKLLPTWVEFEKRVGVSFRDATTYGTSKDKDTFTAVDANEYKSETNPNEKIDLFYNTTANINQMGTEGKALNLLNYMDKMPNFKAYLKANPELEQEITYGSGSTAAIYFTPYLDGYQAIERMLLMDTSIVATLLDNEIPAGLGQIKSGNGGDAKTVTGGSDASKYIQPFIDANKNYPAEHKMQVLKGDAVKEITIKQTDNIIKQQNAKLAAGCTGKELVDQFKTYLNAAFADEIGAGKTYSKLSEIFTTGAAAYNADELIALMRVVKANPDVLYGSATDWREVETLFPRGQNNSRVNNLLQFAGVVFGIQGMGAEVGHLYYSADGKLNDAETTQASYDALDKLSQMYKEGLIVENFYAKASGKDDGNLYRNKYYAKTTDDASYGLMMFDYTATQSAPNDLVNGLGTDPAKRKGVFQGKSVKGIMSVLPPVTYWATQEGWDHTAVLGSDADRAKKTLTRYYEENRAVKTNSWCIPSSSDNIEFALKLMDDMFSEEGNRIQNFGPSTYWTMGTIMGKPSPVLNQAVLDAYSAKGGDIWNFFRQVMGSAHGIGHERPTQLDYQSTNENSKANYAMLTAADNAGVIVTSKCRTKNISWSTTVRTSCYPTISTQNSDQYKAVTSFWANDKLKAAPDGWVSVVVNEAGTKMTGNVGNDGSNYYTMATLKGQFAKKNSLYLYPCAESVGDWAIPAYADAQ